MSEAGPFLPSEPPVMRPELLGLLIAALQSTVYTGGICSVSGEEIVLTQVGPGIHDTLQLP